MIAQPYSDAWLRRCGEEEGAKALELARKGWDEERAALLEAERRLATTRKAADVSAAVSVFGRWPCIWKVAVY